MEEVKVEREYAFTDLKSALIKKWPALVFLLLTCQNYQLVDVIIYTPYYYAFLDYWGGGRYNDNPLNGLVILNFGYIFGIFLGILIVVRFKSIKLLPGISASFMAIGSAVCCIEQAFDEGNVPISNRDMDMTLVSAGNIVLSLGYLLAPYVQNLMIVEMVPSKYRPVFVMSQFAVREIWMAIIQGIYFKFTDEQNLYIGTAAVLGVIAISHFWALCGTNWFSTGDPSTEPELGELKMDSFEYSI